jgi:hypothetical protein
MPAPPFNRDSYRATCAPLAELPLERRLIEAGGLSSRYGGVAYEAAELYSKVSANVGRLPL